MATPNWPSMGEWGMLEPAPKVLVRVTPGVEAHTHEFIRTGQDDSKFGFGLASGMAEQAVQRAAASPAVDLVGLHAHIVSTIGDGPLSKWRNQHSRAVMEKGSATFHSQRGREDLCCHTAAMRKLAWRLGWLRRPPLPRPNQTMHS